MKFISNKSRKGGHKKVWLPEREKGKKQQTCSILFPFFSRLFLVHHSLFHSFSLPLGEIISVEASLLEGREGGGRQMPPPVLPSHTSGKTRDSSRIRQQNFYMHPYFYTAFKKCFRVFLAFLCGKSHFCCRISRPSSDLPFRRDALCGRPRVLRSGRDFFFVSSPSYFGGSKHK